VPRHGWVGAAHMPRSPNKELTSAASAESTWRRLAIRRRCSPTHFNAVSEYQIAHFGFLMTSKTSFHKRLRLLSLTPAGLGSAKSALHLTLNLCTFLVGAAS
jgi:hypothetical protein